MSSGDLFSAEWDLYLLLLIFETNVRESVLRTKEVCLPYTLQVLAAFQIL